jgi:hypothetical protein
MVPFGVTSTVAAKDSGAVVVPRYPVDTRTHADGEAKAGDERAIYRAGGEAVALRDGVAVGGHEASAARGDVESTLGVEEPGLLGRFENSAAGRDPARAVVAAGKVGHQRNERNDATDELEDVEVHREAGFADELGRSEVELAGRREQGR